MSQVCASRTVAVMCMHSARICVLLCAQHNGQAQRLLLGKQLAACNTVRKSASKKVSDEKRAPRAHPVRRSGVVHAWPRSSIAFHVRPRAGNSIGTYAFRALGQHLLAARSTDQHSSNPGQLAQKQFQHLPGSAGLSHNTSDAGQELNNWQPAEFRRSCHRRPHVSRLRLGFGRQPSNVLIQETHCPNSVSHVLRSARSNSFLVMLGAVQVGSLVTIVAALLAYTSSGARGLAEQYIGKVFAVIGTAGSPNTYKGVASSCIAREAPVE